MSDKNLTELEWKKFSKGKGFKDAPFLKALAALELARTPEASLQALDDIEKQADVLRKANKADKELGSYLDDAEKAAGKERKLQEAEAKKAARQSSSDEEDDDSPAALTTKMVPLLRQVRKGEVMRTMVAITGKEVAVLVSKKPIGPPKRKVLTDYLGVSGGVKFAVGEVVWEENANTFVLSTQAAGLAKRIKAALLKQLEQRFKVRVRGEDPSDIDDDGDPAEVGDGQGQPQGTQATQTDPTARSDQDREDVPPAPPLQSTSAPQPPQQDAAAVGDAGAAFNTRLAGLMPRVKEAIAAAGPNATDVKLKVSEAGMAARKRSFDQANALLDEAEQLMTGGGAPSVDASTAFNARLAALMPNIKTALAQAGPQAAELKLKVSEAGVFARKNDFDAAHRALDEAERLLQPRGVGDADAEPGGDQGEEQGGQSDGAGTDPATQYARRLAELEPRYRAVLEGNPADATRLRAVFGYVVEQAEGLQFGKALSALLRLQGMLDEVKPADDVGYKGLAAYRRSLLDFRAAAAKVKGQIAALKAAIPGQSPDDADMADELAEALDELNDDLLAMVDAAMSAAENEASPVTRGLKAQVASYLAEVAASPLIKHVDQNPYGVSMNIAQTLGDALESIRHTLPAPV